MPASEIDDIFASKGRTSAAAPAASSSFSQAPEKRKKKKDKDKSAKRKRDADPDVEEAAPSKPPKRKIPETVFDPSAAVGAPSAKEGRPRKTAAIVAKAQKPKKDREEDGRFKDSRGTGPRKYISFHLSDTVLRDTQVEKLRRGFPFSRKTNLVSQTKAAVSIGALDMRSLSNIFTDTPLCPFDCQCCTCWVCYDLNLF